MANPDNLMDFCELFTITVYFVYYKWGDFSWVMIPRYPWRDRESFICRQSALKITVTKSVRLVAIERVNKRREKVQYEEYFYFRF